MLRKFMMVGLLIFISPGEPAQMGVALLVTLFFLIANLILQPFATPDLNQMQAVSQGSLTLTLFVGLMMIIDAYIAKEQQAAASGPWGLSQIDPTFEMNHFIFSFMAVVVNMTTMVIPPLMMFKNMRSSLPSPKDVPGIISGKIRNGLHSVKVAVGLAPKAKEEKEGEHENADDHQNVSPTDAAAAIVTTEKIKKLTRPGSMRLPKPPQPVASDDARAKPELRDDADKNAAPVREETENTPISANEFREQLLRGTELPKLTAEEDLGQEHPDLISTNHSQSTPAVQSRLRKLAESAREFDVMSDTHLLLQPPPRQHEGESKGEGAPQLQHHPPVLVLEEVHDASKRGDAGIGIAGAGVAILAAERFKKLRKPGSMPHTDEVDGTAGTAKPVDKRGDDAGIGIAGAGVAILAAERFKKLRKPGSTRYTNGVDGTSAKYS